MGENQINKDAVVTLQLREEICGRAYMHFVNAGRAHGHDQEHWFFAETEVLLENVNDAKM